jgi:hypothetical protein
MSRSLTITLIAGLALTAGVASAGTIAVPAPQIPESGYQTVQNQTMTVIATEAEVRANPSPDAQVVTKVMDTNNGFAHVQTPDGAKGYIDLRSLK